MTTTIWLWLLLAAFAANVAFDVALVIRKRWRRARRVIVADQVATAMVRMRAADPVRPPVSRGRTQFDRHVDQAIETTR